MPLMCQLLSGAVIIPRKNESDLEEIPDEIKGKLKFIPVDKVSEVLYHALGLKIKSDVMPVKSSGAKKKISKKKPKKATVVKKKTKRKTKKK